MLKKGLKAVEPALKGLVDHSKNIELQPGEGKVALMLFESPEIPDQVRMAVVTMDDKEGSSIKRVLINNPFMETIDQLMSQAKMESSQNLLDE